MTDRILLIALLLFASLVAALLAWAGFQLYLIHQDTLYLHRDLSARRGLPLEDPRPQRREPPAVKIHLN